MSDLRPVLAVAFVLLGLALTVTTVDLTLVSASLAFLAAGIGYFFLPRYVNLVLATALIPIAREALLWKLTLSDLLLILFCVRSMSASNAQLRLQRLGPVLMWMIWLWTTLLLAQGELSPLARVSVYVATGVALSAENTRVVRGTLFGVTGFALVELMMSLRSLPDRNFGHFIGDPHQFGLLLLLGLNASQLIFGRSKLGKLITGLFAVGLLSTQTRGIWAAAVVFFAAQVMAIRKPSSALLLLVAISLLGIYVYGPVTSALELNDESWGVRERTIQTALPILRESLWFGQGWAAITVFNTYLSLMLYSGVLGAVLYLVLLYRAIRDTSPKHKWNFTPFILAFCTLSFSEMTIYAGALGTLLFFIAYGIHIGSIPAASHPTADTTRSVSGIARVPRPKGT